jgi:putative transposase
MSFTNVIIHAVWGTQNRRPILTSEIRPKILHHIRSNMESKKIYVHSVNGHVDHLHCLFTLNVDTSLSKTLQLIKGESSFWINKNRLTDVHFAWAEEYYASSVSKSDLISVREYVDRQEEHHAIKSFAQEHEELLRTLII